MKLIFIWQNCPIFNNSCTVGQNSQHHKNTLVCNHGLSNNTICMAGAVIWGDLKVTCKQAFLITYHHHITNYTIIIYPFEEIQTVFGRVQIIYLSIKIQLSHFLCLKKGDCHKAYIQILISVKWTQTIFFMVYNVMKMNKLSYHVMKNQKMWQLLLTSHNNYWPVTNYNATSKSTDIMKRNECSHVKFC